MGRASVLASRNGWGAPPHAISKSRISRLKAAGEWGILSRVPREGKDEGEGKCFDDFFRNSRSNPLDLDGEK